MRARRVIAAVIFVVCVMAPIVETFDGWDHTLQDGNDTEANAMIVGLCFGFALVTSAVELTVTHIRALPSLPRPSECVSMFEELSARSRPVPLVSPPTPLRV